MSSPLELCSRVNQSPTMRSIKSFTAIFSWFQQTIDTWRSFWSLPVEWSKFPPIHGVDNLIT